MSDWVKVAVLDNQIAANLLEAWLQERKIPYRLRSYHDIAYDGLFQSQKGWGHVEAPEAYRREIDEYLQDLNPGEKKE
ncbi:hypothetical protein JW992_04640 [candidate division KSB1 bacterium]|nr:hypothetical protein [candidate division KSB1 bacterium]